MLIRILLSCFCSLLYLFTYAQSEMDSLLDVMRSRKPYSSRIHAYITYEQKFGLRNFDQMLLIAKEGIELAIRNDDPYGVAELHRFAGEAWYFKGQYDSAARYYYESINILEKTKEHKKLAAAYNSLAKLYRKTKDLDRALETYNKALGIYTRIQDSSGLSMIMNESGVVYEYAGKYKEAIDRYNTSLAITEKLNDSIGIAYALSNLAGVNTIMKNYKQAEQYLLRALAIRRKLNDEFTLALNYSDLAATYASAGEFVKARTFVDSSVAIAERMQYPELLQTNFNLLAEIAQKQGDYKTALSYFQKRAGIRDSIFSLEKTKQIEELSTQYETVKKEQRILEQQHKISLQNIIITGGLILLILILLLVYTQYKRLKWKEEIKLQQALIKQQQQATRAILEAEETERQRIAKELHDGVGQMMSAAKMNLSAFEHAASFNSSDQRMAFQNIISLVDDSCKEVRSVSHNMMPNALLKHNLAAAIKEFLDKLDQRHLRVHLYTEGLDKRLESNIETVLYRVIQECVNNVIKHSGADTLDITIINDNKEITATIEDNGKGFDVNNEEHLQGIGLRNIRTRVEYLRGSVEIHSTQGQGTLVAVHVPL